VAGGDGLHFEMAAGNKEPAPMKARAGKSLEK